MLPRAPRPAKYDGVDEPRHLLIDGYNILYAWTWLRPGRKSGPAFDAARERLVETIRAIRDGDGIAITIVFDGRGSTVQRDAGSSDAGIAVLFAPAGKTADSVIENLVAAARDPRTCTVATADALERETVTATGATCISPEDLQAWCERSRARATRAAAHLRKKTGSDWNNKLPL